MADVVTIVSGGLDSVTLAYLVADAGDRQIFLSYKYGQKHTKELECAAYHADLLRAEHVIVDLTTLLPIFSTSALVGDTAIPHIQQAMGDPQPASYVPNRNMIFLSIACALAESRGAHEVYYGAQKHDQYGYWDTTPQFVERLNAVFGLQRKSTVQIVAPFVLMSKTQILRWGLEHGVDYAHTWSCYNGREKACGTCPTCSERRRAFELASRNDPVEYEV
jgi:7-cyano-7-deazaguanine synthase